jgi:ribosomal protein S6
MNKQLLVAAAASLCVSAWAAGTSTTAATPSNSTAVPATTSRTTAASDDEKDMLQRHLQAVQTRADYAKALESNGYRISAINADKPNYLEYEVVKNNQSYEVQLDFDMGATKATKIDVTTNMWRADSTKRMVKDAQYKHPTALAADPDGRYSDRKYMKAWTDEKDRLEKTLAPNQPLAAYKSSLERMGYKITSVNDRDANYVEYEIVKGDNSYEVQIDLDPKTKLGKEIDVTTNVWDAEGTDRAKTAMKK